MPDSYLPASPSLSDRYSIERELGQGGMATVYLARDLRHDRKVALKMLRPELSAIVGTERFLHEIRTTANLQHPHILPLHDSGEIDGTVFYVMPYVEGETLRDRLLREKQLPVEDAVRIAQEIADALDYAHRHGVVHRDIKPENILLHDDHVQVADFGIALAMSTAGAGTRMTETGMSLGTPHYMAPEQAMGEREISPRADVYALGCVLYEMLTGEPPFTGPTAQAIIARVVTESPRGLQAQRHTIPSHVEAAVRRALEKLPADRFPTAAEFSDALSNRAFGVATAADAAYAASAGRSQWHPRAWRTPTRVFAALAAAMAAVALWSGMRGAGPPEESPLIAAQVMDSVPGGVNPLVARDGTIAWVSRGTLYLRHPGSTAAVAVPGAEGIGDAIDFSPDGKSIAFVVFPPNRDARTKGTVRKLSLAGGGPQPLMNEVPGAPTENTVSLVWGDDGYIYLSALNLSVRTGYIFRFPEGGGRMDTLFTAAGSYLVATDALPRGSGLLVTVLSATLGDQRIVAFDLTRRDTVSVVHTAVHGIWSASGHVLFTRFDGTLQAMPFDSKSLRSTGSAVTVADSITASFSGARYSLSPTGTLVYVRGASSIQAGGTHHLALVDLSGSIDRLPLPPTDHWDGAISPNGRLVAYVRGDQIWLYDLDVGTHRQFTDGGNNHHNPAFSPDGKRIAFRASREDGPTGDVYIQPVDDGQAVRLGGSPAGDNPSQWLPDDVILSYGDSPNADILRMKVDSGSRSIPVLNADWAESAPKVSPDGRWMVYRADEGGVARWYLRRWPELTGKTVISETSRSQSQPLWTPDSRTLIYQERDQLVAATVGAGTEFQITARRVISTGISGPVVAMHPDGRRMLAFVQEDQRSNASSPVAPRMIVVANWHTALRQRLGAEGR
jgi:eukaryotic-like serine/threonine-protein kinase